MNPEAVARICDAISSGSPDEAAALARAELPFEPFERTKRFRSDAEKVSVFLRDGFIDRYSGQRLVFPGTLLLLSHLMPAEIPYHSNWDTSKCHMVFWYLSPTVDHVDPVARGGPDTTDNLVCTSMPRNDAKRHWTLEELGWHPCLPGSLLEWDGLLSWFMDYTSDKPRVLEERPIKRWHSAAKRALRGHNRQDLPSSLRSYSHH
ncbi:MAG: HNH endonuclease [Acidimicrobiia bacterium]|nr:HNH endonuclease [Acidimicrobiia bacterium]MYC46216.1 HNH endonuclease [Acidimicrobiia bacterium]MYI19379.1 HNH endonuclease [Acidimicrobiia bacterium]